MRQKHIIGELIGSIMEIKDLNIKGKVIDETKHMIILQTNKGIKKLKK